MAFPSAPRQQQQLLPEADGGNHLNGAYANQPPTLIGGAGAPAAKLELVDAVNPQVRLTNAAGLYTDLFTGPAGSLRMLPSGGKIGINLSATPNGALQIAGLVPPAVPTTPGTSADYAIYALGAVGGDTTIATTGQAGNGGRVLISGGNGGNAPSAATAATGGNGGTAGVYGGHGAPASVAGTGTNSGGGGAAITIAAGNGGNASGATSGANTGGVAGSVTITGGTGGAASAGSGALAGGAGGNVSLSAGAGGGGTTGGNGGTVLIAGGAPGAGTPGTRGTVVLQNTPGFGFVGIGGTPGVQLHQAETSTITGAVPDGYAAGQRHQPTYSGAFLVTRHNYMDLINPALAGGATMTDACVMRFDAAVGTHRALAAASTKTTPGTVNGWLKINVAGTLYFIPAYTSMTS